MFSSTSNPDIIWHRWSLLSSAHSYDMLWLIYSQFKGKRSQFPQPALTQHRPVTVFHAHSVDPVGTERTPGGFTVVSTQGHRLRSSAGRCTIVSATHFGVFAIRQAWFLRFKPAKTKSTPWSSGGDGPAPLGKTFQTKQFLGLGVQSKAWCFWWSSEVCPPKTPPKTAILSMWAKLHPEHRCGVLGILYCMVCK